MLAVNMYQVITIMEEGEGDDPYQELKSSWDVHMNNTLLQVILGCTNILPGMHRFSKAENQYGWTYHYVATLIGPF